MTQHEWNKQTRQGHLNLHVMHSMNKEQNLSPSFLPAYSQSDGQIIQGLRWQ